MTLRREATASSTDERRAPRHRSRGPGLGRVPFTVRVAVTGHRHLRRPDVVGAGVDAALDLIRTLFPARADTPVVLTAVSSLAEGADRVVAERVLATTGGGLEVALPLPADDYRSDFDSAWSDAEFEELVERASLVVEGAASGDRVREGYERAGQYVVDRADVLVAVWDGEPSRGRGGTAETIAYALNRRVPVVVVHSDDGSVSLDDGQGRPGQVFLVVPGGTGRGSERPRGSPSTTSAPPSPISRSSTPLSSGSGACSPARSRPRSPRRMPVSPPTSPPVTTSICTSWASGSFPTSSAPIAWPWPTSASTSSSYGWSSSRRPPPCSRWRG